jgi:hydrogenase small subunit
MKVMLTAAAAVGMTGSLATKMARAAEKGVRPSIIWLNFQECTGCTESLLRTSRPDIAEVILDHVSLDYHETLMAASGYQAEEALQAAMKLNKGKYILVVEGAIPTKENGIYCKVAGKTAIDSLKECAENAGAIIAIGSCASWGGIPSAPPNPTGSVGANSIITNKPVVTLPGCPANPYIFLGVAFQFAALGSLPELDEKGRPKFAYGRVIHEHCPRRAHFDAGRFAQKFGDAGHRLGYCLYKLGCKGPATHANCSVNHFCEVVDAWPIGIGAPCFGCTEQDIAFKVPASQTIDIRRPTPPDTYPEIEAERGVVNPIATGVAGLVAGGLLGASWMTSKFLKDNPQQAPSKPDAADAKKETKA